MIAVNNHRDISEMVQEWSAVDERPNTVEYDDLHALILDLEKNRFYEYLPTSGAHRRFITRLEDCLNTIADENDRRTFFRLVPEMLFFITAADFTALYRFAMQGPIARWLVNTLGFDLADPDITAHIRTAIKKTWFCSLTDSMAIAAFSHVNHIRGQELRPDWLSLAKLGDKDRIIRHMREYGYERIVLLEDFVGTGGQIKSTVNYAASILPATPILVLPLVVCPTGVTEGRLLMATHTNVVFDTVLPIPLSEFIPDRLTGTESPLMTATSEMLERTYSLVNSNGDDPYGKFGYKNTGAIIVTYSNCPDNTVPLLHHKSDRWAPLFPRSSRT